MGDLVSRGPDSVGVVELVNGLIELERAQGILGNHELNILLNHRKAYLMREKMYPVIA